jgi:branched-chain amino acid transport system permease protein
VKSIEVLMMVVIGGLGSVPGTIAGALIVVLSPELLRSSGEMRLIIFGVLVIVLVGVGRGGVAAVVRILAHRLSTMRSLFTGQVTRIRAGGEGAK